MDQREFGVVRASGVVLFIIGGVFYLHQQVAYAWQFATLNDFKHLYLAGYLAARGGNFFDAGLMLRTTDFLQIPPGINPFVYPPFFALLLIPLAWLDFQSAWLLFTLASHAAFWIALLTIVSLVRRDESHTAAWLGILTVLAAAFFPLLKNYTAGQMNTFLLLIIALAAYLYHRGAKIQTGLLLGFGASLKVAPAFLLLYFAWKREWRILAAGLTFLAAAFFISLAVLGIEPHLAFLHEVRQMGYGSSTWAQYGQHFHVEPHNQSPSALWYRLLTDNPVTQGIMDSPWLAKAFSYLTAAGIFAFLLAWTPRTDREQFLEEYSMWTLAMLLLPSLMWDHYLVQAVLAIAVMLRLLLEGKTRAALLLGLGLALVLVPTVYDRPSAYFEQPIFLQGWATLAMPVKLYGLLMLAVYLALHRKPAANPTSNSAESKSAAISANENLV